MYEVMVPHTYPDIATYTHTQNGAYKWMSTHRSEKTSSYAPLVIYN